MTNEDHQSYYRRRAVQERQRAATSEDNAVAMIHLDLADAYEERATNAGRIEQPTLIPRRSS